MRTATHHKIRLVFHTITIVATIGTIVFTTIATMYMRETSCWHEKTVEIWRTGRPAVMDCDDWRDWVPFVEKSR